jgi:RNA polymerase sigma-70 factor (ECF subfamily)
VRDDTDAEVITASWTDPSVFEEIYRRHHKTVLAYTLRCAGQQDGPDVAAEVFEEALRSRRSYNPEYQSARGWLLGIAAHVIVRYYRRRSKLRTVRYDEKNNEPDGDLSDDIATQVDARRIVDRAMRKLNSDEREVVSLFVFADLPYQQIADSLGIPVGTVRSRLNRARGKLRNFFAASNQYIDEGPPEDHE